MGNSGSRQLRLTGGLTVQQANVLRQFGPASSPQEHSDESLSTSVAHDYIRPVKNLLALGFLREVDTDPISRDQFGRLFALTPAGIAKLDDLTCPHCRNRGWALDENGAATGCSACVFGDAWKRVRAS